MHCHIWVCSILIIWNSDTENNPGPRRSSCENFSVCHWNLNNISAHYFIYLSLLSAYLDSNISCNNNLTKPGYDLYRADHPSNV